MVFRRQKPKSKIKPNTPYIYQPRSHASLFHRASTRTKRQHHSREELGAGSTCQCRCRPQLTFEDPRRAWEVHCVAWKALVAGSANGGGRNSSPNIVIRRALWAGCCIALITVSMPLLSWFCPPPRVDPYGSGLGALGREV